jgi:hypothetical protein
LSSRAAGRLWARTPVTECLVCTLRSLPALAVLYDRSARIIIGRCRNCPKQSRNCDRCCCKCELMHGALLDCFAQLQLKAMTDGQGRKGCYFENDPEMFWHRLDSDQVQHSSPVVSASSSSLSPLTAIAPRYKRLCNSSPRRVHLVFSRSAERSHSCREGNLRCPGGSLPSQISVPGGNLRSSRRLSISEWAAGDSPASTKLLWESWWGRDAESRSMPGRFMITASWSTPVLRQTSPGRLNSKATVRFPLSWLLL